MANTVRVGITAADEGFKSTLNQMEQSSNKFASSLSKSGKQANTFNGQLRSLRKQAVELAYAYDQLDEQAKNSDFGQSMKAQLQEVLNTAGQMQDIKGDVAEEIKNIASDTRTWDGMKEGIGVVSSSLQGLASIYGMLGGDTKEFTKALVAVNAVQSVSNTIIGIGNALQKQSALMVMLRTAKEKLFGAAKAKNTALTITNTSATVAETAAMTAETGATSTATAATWSFNAALAANPIGAVVVAVAALCAGIYALTQILNKATDEEEGFAEAAIAANEATKSGHQEYMKTRMEMDRLIKTVNTFKGTKEEEKRLVDELNSKYGDALGKYKSLNDWKSALATTTLYYCKVMQAEAKYAALSAAAYEAYADALAGEDYSKNMAKFNSLKEAADAALDDVMFYQKMLKIAQSNAGAIVDSGKSSKSGKSGKGNTKSTDDKKTALEQLDEQIKKHEKELASLDKSEGKNIDTINKLKSTIASLRAKKLVYIDTKSLSGLKEYKKELSEIRKLYDEHSDNYKNVNAQIDTINDKMLTVIETMSQSDNIEILSEAQSSLDELTKSLDVTSKAFQRAAQDARLLNKKIEEINRIRNNELMGVQIGSATDLKQQMDAAIKELQDYANNTHIDLNTAFNEGGFDEQYEKLKKKAIELADAWTTQRSQFRGVEVANVKPVDITFDYKKTELEKLNDEIQYQENLRDWYLQFDIQIDEDTTFNKFQDSLDETREKIKQLKSEASLKEIQQDLKEASETLNNTQWDTIKGTGSNLGDMYSSIKGIGEAFNDAKDPVEAFFKAFDSVTSVVDNILDLIDLYKELNAAITAFNAVKEAETALTTKNAAMKTVENEQQSETLVQKQTEATIMQENAAALGEQAAATTALNIVKETSNVLSEKSAGAQAAEAVALGTSTSAIGAQAAAETAALAPKEAAVQVNQQLAVAAMDMAAANIAAAHSEIPFVGPALAAAGIATVTAATVSAHGAMVGLQAFAQGGIVKGSTTMGDSTLIRVNSGEMVINKIQQANLFKLLNNGSVSGNNNVSVDGSVRIKGSDLQIALSNYKKITGKTV